MERTELIRDIIFDRYSDVAFQVSSFIVSSVGISLLFGHTIDLVLVFYVSITTDPESTPFENLLDASYLPLLFQNVIRSSGFIELSLLDNIRIEGVGGLDSTHSEVADFKSII